MKANEGKKKPAMHDKKHHEHVPAYLKNESSIESDKH